MRVRICFAALPKPVPVAGFVIYKNNSVTSVSKIYHYRPPVLVKSEYGWYIKYHYRIPVAVRHIYGNKEWYRFRVKEDLNRRKGQDRLEYAEWLLSEITQSLKNGYNPFEPEKQVVEQGETQIEPELNATDAMYLFLEKWTSRGLESSSLSKYNKVVTRFIVWLKKVGIPYTDVNNITQTHIENFLTDAQKTYLFGNREFNNHYDFIRTAFNFLLKKKYISVSPVAGVDKMKSKTTKHRYYDEKSLNDVTRILELKDPYTLLAFQTVYYLCVRSEKEMKHLKVGNINWEQNKILAIETKGGSERYIPMDDHLKELFLKAGINKYPDDYYVFSIGGKPGKKPFGRDFFAKKFRKVRDEAGLSDSYTIYGAKHTRIVHLKSDGVSDADIMSLTGHKDFTSYTKYLRDLGLTADIKNINAKSRKI